MSDLHETKEWKDMIADVDRQIAEEGGSTGSNMAEPPWTPPGRPETSDNLPREEIDKFVDRLAAAATR